MTQEAPRPVDLFTEDKPQIQASSFAIDSFQDMADAEANHERRLELVQSLHDLFKDTTEQFGITEFEKYRTSSGDQEGSKNVPRRVTPPVQCTLDDGRSLMDIKLGEVIDSNGNVLGYEAQYYSQDGENLRHSAGIYMRKRTSIHGDEVFDGLRLEMSNDRLEGAVGFLKDIQNALRENQQS